MAKLHAFKGYRPGKEKVNVVASRPYDVLNSSEAREEVKGNPWSFLHVVKPEVDLPEDTDLHSDAVYYQGKENLQKLISEGYFIQDQSERLYVYGQTMFGKTQYGIVACAAVDDYLNDIIKKHELTRPDKEEDRMNHIRVTNFNAEPVFFAYPDNDVINTVVVATRHDSHAGFVLNALSASKHVFVEKPLCLKLDELDEINSAYQELIEKGDAPIVMVGFNRRFSPQVQKIKTLLDSVSMPKSFIMTVNAGAIPADHWAQDSEAGGGRIIGEACHFIDLLRFLAGAPITEHFQSFFWK